MYINTAMTCKTAAKLPLLAFQLRTWLSCRRHLARDPHSKGAVILTWITQGAKSSRCSKLIKIEPAKPL